MLHLAMPIIGCTGAPECPEGFYAGPEGACYEGTGGGDDTGTPDTGDADTDADADADTDADTDTDTDTDTGDTGVELLDSFSYGELSDVIAWDGPTHFLATNPAENSLDLIDVTTGDYISRVALGGSPSRVTGDPATGTAYVVHGAGSLNRMDIVDVIAGTNRQILLNSGGVNYAGTDVALGPSGVVYVLADGDSGASSESVLEIDAAGTITTVWLLGESSNVDPPMLWQDGLLYAEFWRFRFDSAPSLATERQYADGTWPSPSHVALSPDGVGILFSGDDERSAVEYDTNTAAILNQFDLADGDAAGANDLVYSYDGTRVIALVLVGTQLQIQVFDRVTSTELRNENIGADDGAASYETEILVVSSDDANVWTYVFDPIWNADEGIFMRVPIP